MRRARPTSARVVASGATTWDATSFRPAVDGLRAVAVLVVIVGHTMLHTFPGGGLGVDLFFAISGFLITGLLVAEVEASGRVHLAKFYGRRMLRLLPALLLMLAVTIPFFRPEPLQIAGVLFYFANWLRVAGDGLGAYGPMWSLAIEEQFYLVWPLLVIGCGALAAARGWPLRRSIALVACVGIVIANVLRIVLWGNGERIYNGTDTRMDGLLFGALLAVAMPTLVARGWTRWLHWLSIPSWALLAFGLLSGFTSIAFMAVVPLACAIIVGSAAAGPIRPVDWLLSNPVTLWIGKRSYAMYLWHYPLLFMLPTMNPRPRTLAVLACTLIVAWLSFALVERPLTRWLKPRLVASPAPHTR